ncbi:MAG TPA: nuclear transport factor 2 family protein [Gemmatimonadales bacterium]
MARYVTALRSANPDSIAAFFSPTAMLLEPGIAPLITRDSIRAFLASFGEIRVDSAAATPDTIEILNGSAFLWGSYFERAAFPGQPVSEQHGRFVTWWVRQPDGRWLMQRLMRVPI